MGRLFLAPGLLPQVALSLILLTAGLIIGFIRLPLLEHLKFFRGKVKLSTLLSPVVVEVETVALTWAVAVAALAGFCKGV